MGRRNRCRSRCSRRRPARAFGSARRGGGRRPCFQPARWPGRKRRIELGLTVRQGGAQSVPAGRGGRHGQFGGSTGAGGEERRAGRVQDEDVDRARTPVARQYGARPGHSGRPCNTTGAARGAADSARGASCSPCTASRKNRPGARRRRAHRGPVDDRAGTWGPYTALNSGVTIWIPPRRAGIAPGNRHASPYWAAIWPSFCSTRLRQRARSSSADSTKLPNSS